MYEKYPIVQEIIPEAVEFIIHNDRYRYIDAYFIIEDMISAADQDILIGGPIAHSILLTSDEKKNITKDTFEYHIYIENPYEFAKKMCQKIYESLYYSKKGEAGEKSSWIDTINVETNIINKIYTLWIDLRQIVRFISMDKYRRKVAIAALVKPIMKKSLFFDNIFLPLIAPEVLLIEIYQKLYNPYPTGGRDYKQYSQLLTQESKLFEIINAPPSSKDGAGPGRKPDEDNSSSFYKMNKIIKDILMDIIEELKDRAILIGDFSRTGNDFKSGRLQLLSTSEPEDLLSIIDNILNENKPTGEKIPLKIVKFDIHLPVDIFIKKSIIYAEVHSETNESQIPICEIFNSPSYELISTLPTTKTEIRRAGLAAQMRFRLIDIWVLLIIKGLNESCGKNNNFTEQQIRKSREELLIIRQEFYKNLENSSNIFEVFPVEPSSYFGQYIDENVRKKMIIMEENKGKRFPRFFPEFKTAD
jgi:hypothetical protein